MNVPSIGDHITDGVPHLTFQHPEVDINFVWDGCYEHGILVCPYGYGEQPDDVIEIEDYDLGESPIEVLEAFKKICMKYLMANKHFQNKPEAPVQKVNRIIPIPAQRDRSGL